jgi:hypothetical protein
MQFGYFDFKLPISQTEITKSKTKELSCSIRISDQAIRKNACPNCLLLGNLAGLFYSEAKLVQMPVKQYTFNS